MQRQKAQHKNNGPHKAKVINMVARQGEDQKRKLTVTSESWMNVPITFPSIATKEWFEEAIVIESEIGGYLVWRIHVDKGASVEIMYKHCFDNLHPSIKSRMVEMQTTLLGFSGEPDLQELLMLD
jgi:hypothetical protein